jgi:hypothetical protein
MLCSVNGNFFTNLDAVNKNRKNVNKNYNGTLFYFLKLISAVGVSNNRRILGNNCA